MPIDPSIPLQVQPLKLESPMNQLAMMSDAMKIGEMQRGIGVQNELRNLYAQGVDVSTPEGFKQIASVDPMGAIKLRTTAMEGRKLEAETGLKEYELKNNKINTAITRLANLHSPQEAAASIAEQVQSGDIPPERGQQLMRELQTMPFQQFKTSQLTGILSAKDNLANQQDVKRTNIAGGHLQVAKENQALQYGPDVVANTVTDNAGNVTQFNRQGKIIGQPGAVGKPSATHEKTIALQKQQGKDINLAISEIENAIKPGGTLEKATSSGAGKLRDAAGNFIGYATEGSIAAASLKPVGDLALKMVPRFEGPQSDKDTASYKEASGQLANEGLPVATRKAAAQTVLRIMRARKGQFVNEAMANEGIGAGGPTLPAGFTPD